MSTLKTITLDMGWFVNLHTYDSYNVSSTYIGVYNKKYMYECTTVINNKCKKSYPLSLVTYCT